MIRIRSALTDGRHALAAASVIATLGLAVLLAHSTPAGDHMPGMGAMDDSHATQSMVVTMCLAVIGLGTAGAGLVALRRRCRRSLTVPMGHGPGPRRTTAFEQARPFAKARAGPSLLQVYRL